MNNDSSTEELLQEIQRLWSSSYHGILSTHSLKFPGYPFGSLLPFCRDTKGNLLLLISHLAQHTRNLEGNPSCSLTLIEQGSGDVQQLARLTCLSQVEAVNSTASAERYFRFYPETRRYQKELNFRFYRLQIEHFYFIGGFGSARWIDPGRIPLPTPFSTADEAEILYQLNAHERDLLNHLLNGMGMPGNSPAEAVGADPKGLDIRVGGDLKRLQLNHSQDDKRAFLARIAEISKQSSPDISSR
ncbi:MAG: pyridoxamine 5'-phosphate oxidase family protein [Candidatus Thiodiazotropha sp.]